jgi:3'(2'), 5'-bisphosphate nucleotidase
MMNEQELLNSAIKASISAGKEILSVYSHEFEVEFKEDKSPLTRADQRAHKSICAALKETGIPVLSEEGKNIPYAIRKNWKRLWMVDPLDGTKEFVKRNGEFTVNIALIEDSKAVMGIILAPVTGMLYFASRSAGAFKTRLAAGEDIDPNVLVANASGLPSQGLPVKLTVIGSRSHPSMETTGFIQDLRKTEADLDFISVGSSLKMCLIAEGKAHIYPRFGPTMEWDTAAGQAILEISGGHLISINDKMPVHYNKPELLNPWFIASRPR